MRLKPYGQTLEEKLSEFDNWITPSLTEIKDSKQFHRVRRLIADTLDELPLDAEGLRSNASIDSIVLNFLKNIQDKEDGLKKDLLSSFINLLFIVTGKSDNNSKCQFPVYLNEKHPNGYPKVTLKGAKRSIIITKIPRVIKAESVVDTTIKLNIDFDQQLEYLTKYVRFILNEEIYFRSLIAIGSGYHKAKSFGLGLDFLLPLVVFKIRGSESATGGHKPEHTLRSLMQDWGLYPREDFNITDHIVDEAKDEYKTLANGNFNITDHIVDAIEDQGEQEEDGEDVEVKNKTRAYDFFLPLQAYNESHKILVQSQFYAGDSGSVSHKNIDQTRTSRDASKAKINNIIFVEFVDGAGYYSSLNGDLKKLLQMNDTFDFFQIRTAVIKLRRILQQIHFLTPLEFLHACALCAGNKNEINKFLANDNYSHKEIQRVLQKSQVNGFITIDGDSILIKDEQFWDKSRKYFLLDSIVNNSHELDMSLTKKEIILVPGYKLHYGVEREVIYDSIVENSGMYKKYWNSKNVIEADVNYLAGNQWIKVK